MSNPQCASLLLNTANTAFNVPKIHNIDTSSFNHGHGASSSFTNTDNTQQGQQTLGYSNYNADDAGDTTSSQAKAFDAWANYLINKFKNGWDGNTSPITPTGGFRWQDGVESFPIHEPKPITYTTPAVDPKPIIYVTPVAEPTPIIHSTPIHEPKIEDYIEGFTIHVPKLEDYISFNKVWDEPAVKEELPSGSIDLDDHEKGTHDGHTIIKHVDKDIPYLQGRNLREATSYPDKATAEEVIGKIVDDKAQGIADWANDPTKTRPQSFDLDLGREIGYGINKGDTDVSPRTKARVVLVKTANDEIKILTSYPIS